MPNSRAVDSRAVDSRAVGSKARWTARRWTAGRWTAGGGTGSQAGGSGVVVDPQGVLRVLTMSDSNLSRIRQQSSVEQLPRDLRRPSKLRKIALGRLETVLTNLLNQDDGLSR